MTQLHNSAINKCMKRIFRFLKVEISRAVLMKSAPEDALILLKKCGIACGLLFTMIYGEISLFKGNN